MMREFTVQLPSGRMLEASEGGDPKGLPIFALHGTPGSRLFYPPHVADAKSRRIRLLSYNRPGYGGSTPLPGRRLVDDATDVASIADSLGIDKFAVWGHSGGGAPALSCAAVLPQRVVACASLAGGAPSPPDGPDRFAGMGEFNVADLKLQLSNQAEWERKSREDADEMLRATPAELVQMLVTLLSDVDKSAMSHPVAAWFHDQVQEAFKTGIRGYCDDNLSWSKDWGFDPASIKVPVQVWHGRHDKFTPFSTGERLVSLIPHVEAHLEPDEGHVSLLTRRIPDVHRWLVAKF